MKTIKPFSKVPSDLFLPVLVAVWTLTTLYGVVWNDATRDVDVPALFLGAAILFVFAMIAMSADVLVYIRTPILAMGLVVHAVALAVPAIPDTTGLAATFGTLMFFLFLPFHPAVALQRWASGSLSGDSKDLGRFLASQRPLLQAMVRELETRSSKDSLRITIGSGGLWSGAILKVEHDRDGWDCFFDFKTDTQSRAYLFDLLVQRLRDWAGPRSIPEMRAIVEVHPPTTIHEKMEVRAQELPVGAHHKARFKNDHSGLFDVRAGAFVAFAIGMGLWLHFQQFESMDPAPKVSEIPDTASARRYPLRADHLVDINDHAVQGWAYVGPNPGMQVVCVRTSRGEIYTYLVQHTHDSPHLELVRGDVAREVFENNACVGLVADF